MRKAFFLLIAVCVLSLVSCDKTKECECTSTYTVDNVEVQSPVTLTTTIQEGNCSDGDATVTMAGITVETTCIEL